jgi:hypothetical protein
MQRSVLIASIWFQALWFLAVLGREATLIPLFMLVVATYIWSIKQQTLTVSIVLIFAMGFAVDFMNYRVGLYHFDGANLLGLPLWLTLLWCMFAWYAVMMKPVINRFHPLVVIGFSAVGGTLSYLAGARFGAVGLPFGTLHSASVLAVEWVLIAFVIIKLTKSNRKCRSKTAHPAYKRKHTV